MTGKIPKRNLREGIDEYGRTDIHYASDAGTIERLIVGGADINLQDDNGLCPMHFYAQENNISAIDVALKNGATPNLVDSHGNSPLWTATMNVRGDFSCIEALLKAGANANHKNKHDRSPFDIANTIKGGLEKIYDKY